MILTRVRWVKLLVMLLVTLNSSSSEYTENWGTLPSVRIIRPRNQKTQAAGQENSINIPGSEEEIAVPRPGSTMDIEGAPNDVSKEEIRSTKARIVDNLTKYAVPEGRQDVTDGASNQAETPVKETVTSPAYIGNSQYPFIAAIHRQDGEPSFDQVICTGGILRETAVVTTCSCLYGENWPSPPMGEYYYVTAGHKKFARINETQIFSVDVVKYHQSCNKVVDPIVDSQVFLERWQGNVALLQLVKPGMTFSAAVQPMKLPKLKMWDASDVLAIMTQQRRHCRVIGWSAKAPMIDAAIGELIPFEECVSRWCSRMAPCPKRTTVNGFMVEITPNEPSLMSGALLLCSDYIWTVVNTKRQCPQTNAFAMSSPEELIFSTFDFELTDEENRAMSEYTGTFKHSLEGWENYTYEKHEPAEPDGKLKMFKKMATSGSAIFPFYVIQEASWMFTYIFATGYFYM